MAARRWLIVSALVAVLGGCGEQKGRSEPHTLYRNSPLDPSMRIHWASFDADDGGSYNEDNCRMAARLLNANMTASAAAEGLEPHRGVGFWCERGGYEQKGPVPSEFAEAFPTDA